MLPVLEVQQLLFMPKLLIIWLFLVVHYLEILLFNNLQLMPVFM